MVDITIDIISNKLKTVADLINSRKLKNIVVISKSGEIIGRVRELRIKGFNVEGIVISKLFSSYRGFIDKAFIKRFNQDQILLRINPVMSLKGLTVYDLSGRKIGKVKSILRQDNRNDFTSLVVKAGLFSKPILIQKDQIEVMKKNIILNVDYKERQKSIFSKKRRK